MGFYKLKNFIFRVSILSAFFASLIPCVGISAAAVPASEQEIKSDKKNASDSAVTTLPDFTVVGFGRPDEEVIPAQRLDGKALEQLNSHNVADAIRYFSGVQIKDYGGVGGVKTVDIRSMGTNHLGVFYDGIQLGNAQNGQIDLGKFSLDNIEEISLYNGQKSDIFQSAKDFGSAGTIYLRTRRPKFKGGRRFNFNATFRTGSFGLANPSLRFEYKISDRVSISANAEYTYANGKYKFRYRKLYPNGNVAWDTTATRRNGDIESWRIEAGAFGNTATSRWHAKIYFYDSEKGIPGAIVNNVWKNSQRQWDRNFFAQASWQKQFGSKWELMANAKYARDYMRYLNPDTTLMYIDNKFRQDETYLSLVGKYEIMSGWEVSAAADWQWNALDASLVNFAMPKRNTLLTSLATAWRRFGLKAQGSILGTFVFDRSDIVSGSERLGRRHKRFHEFTPAVFLSWQPWEAREFNIRAFYKKIFRMPTFNDLYYTDIGNADLKPEYVSQYNLGAVYDFFFPTTIFRSLHLSADAYHNRITDKIIAVPKGTGQYRWMMMNIGKVRIWGLDFTASLEMNLPKGITINGRLNYTFQRALDYSDPSDNKDAAGTYRGQIAYIPRHSGSAVLAGYWWRFNLNYSFIYVGERWHNSSNIPVNYEQPWYTHDLALAYAQPIKNSTLRISLEINNLLNQQYEVIANYPMPGTNFKLILQYDL